MTISIPLGKVFRVCRGPSLRLGAFVAEAFEYLKQEVAGGARIVSLSGLTSVSAKAYVLARLQAETGKQFAVVTEY